MSIRLEGDWYVDSNDNRWEASRYTVERAEELSSTLRNCTHCTNCTNCTNCVSCFKCTDCFDCGYCIRCISCIKCSYCDTCSACRHCTNCNKCDQCFLCSRCTSCDHCSRCTGCTYCSECIECSYCARYAVNPQRICGWTMGSRDDIPKVYWIKAGEEQCVVGCFRGTLDELEARVKETHKDNPKHLHDYLTFIKAVRAYQEACKDADVL